MSFLIRKTSLVKSLIAEWSQFSTIAEEPLVVFCYNAQKPDLGQAKGHFFHQGLTPVSVLKDLKSKHPQRHLVVIYDDIFSLLETVDKDGESRADFTLLRTQPASKH